MRKAPTLLSGFFIFVTLSRVSSFSASMGDEKISFAIAIGLGLSVFFASYWTQYKGNTNAKENEQIKIKSVISFSWFVLVLVTIIDGIFNLADVLSYNDINMFSVIYGITPTILALLLGILQAKIDVLPVIRAGSGYQISLAVKKYVLAFFDNRNQPEPTGTQKTQSEAQPEPTEIKPELLPIGFPENGTTREKAEFLYKHNRSITGAKIGQLLNVSNSRGRALIRLAKSGNGKVKA